MKKSVRELKADRAELIGQARAMLELADTEKRELTAEEEKAYTDLQAQIDKGASEIARREKLEAQEAELSQLGERRTSASPSAPAHLRTGLGDTAAKATAHYLRTGDTSGIDQLGPQHGDEFSFDLQAVSNATDLNVGTPGDGGVLVPTGHYQGIIAKKNELALYGPLGVTPIPGRGLTVDVPYESGVANEFVAGTEISAQDEDAPAFDTAAMTLVPFTKDVVLSNMLLDTEDSQLLTFLEGWVGRALAKTHNKALITEALANGTAVALGDDALVTVGDPETLEFALAAEYADNAAFVMARATEGKFRKLVGSPFQYQATPPNADRREFDHYPVFNSSYVPAVGAGNKSILFGAFEYMGMREGGMTFLRNPYLKGSTRQVVLHYYAYIVYKVLNAEAILYGKNPTG